MTSGGRPATPPEASAPAELHDEDGAIIAIRIDGPEDTRGKAKAFFAREWDVEFTEARVRKTTYGLDPGYVADHVADGIEEPYDGWPLFAGRGDVWYWTLDSGADR